MAMTLSAQQTEKQVATLQHGDQTSVFYGIDAFKQAYDAAADTLDVITLSGGDFNVPNYISKSIALYGTGFERDTITGAQRTYLKSSLYLKPADAPDEDGNTIKAAKRVNGIHIEGVYVDGNIYASSNNDVPIHNLSVVKCRIGHLATEVDLYDCVIRQSYLYNYVACPSGVHTTAHNFLISNCHISGFYSTYSGLDFRNFRENSTILIDHCILGSSYMYGQVRYTNNIINGWSIPTEAESANNIFISKSGTATTITTDGSWYDMKSQGVWAAEGEDGSYAEDKDFALKYPERYIATDGTQIGLHGGTYAWNKTPSLPRITECTIDTQNATNGTLKVSIKAEAQTKE